MLATFVIEIVCVIYVLWRYKLTPVTRLAAMVLIGLATFQIAEYNICEGAWGVESLTWAKIGYVVITLLPPLGLHLSTKLAGQKQPVLIGVTYGLAALFTVFFLFVGNGVQAEQCLGNYVIFSTAPWAVIPYAVYYYGLLMLSVGYAWQAAKNLKSSKKKVLSTRLPQATSLSSCQRQRSISSIRPLSPASLRSCAVLPCCSLLS